MTESAASLIKKIGSLDICFSASAEGKQIKIALSEVYYIENVEREQITTGASSYIKIADGCNYSCGYCVIPKLKGKYKVLQEYLI